jgi:hypothetical protein
MAKEIQNLDKLKLIFSTLFARKMPYAIFGLSDSQESTTIIFTNISLDEAIIYEPTSEQYVHMVSLKDIEFVTWLYNSFPILKQHKCILDIKKFLSVMNKVKNENVVIELDGTSLVIIATKIKEVCGTIVDDSIVNTYKNIFDGYNKTLPWDEINKEHLNLLTDTEYKDDVNIMEVLINRYNIMINEESSLFRIYATQGKDLPSIKECTKKSKEPCFVKLLTQIGDKAIRVKYVFNSDFAYVESVCPSMFWFPKNICSIKEKEISNG